MKKTIEAEPTETRIHDFPDIGEFAPITVREEIKPEVVVAPAGDAVVLDGILATIKWIFLFLPGAAALHLMMMGFALLLFYRDWSPEIIAGSLGITLVSTFMVMLGIGKLRNLKYLKVVGAILAAGGIAAIFYGLSITFIPGDFFGWFTLLALPVTVLMGQLMKWKIDKEDGASS